jgi:adenylate cyclase
MLGELIPCGGGDPIPLLKPTLLIGRRSTCDVSLRFPNVSSHHCELELVNGYWSVRDLGSTNGIKVNGVRCDQKWLMPGDVLAVAKHRYEIVYEPDTTAPPPEEDADPFAQGLLEKAGLVSRGHGDDDDDEVLEHRRPAKESQDDDDELEIESSPKIEADDDDVMSWFDDDKSS